MQSSNHLFTYALALIPRAFTRKYSIPENLTLPVFFIYLYVCVSLRYILKHKIHITGSHPPHLFCLGILMRFCSLHLQDDEWIINNNYSIRHTTTTSSRWLTWPLSWIWGIHNHMDQYIIRTQNITINIQWILIEMPNMHLFTHFKHGIKHLKVFLYKWINWY